MKRLLQLVLAAVGLYPGCAQSPVLSPSEFTREFSKALNSAAAELKVVTVKDLELQVTTADGREFTVFLDNAYDVYQQDPNAKMSAIQRFVASTLETVGSEREEVDRSRIVPVIKDRAWLEETRQAILNRGAKEAPENVYEDFNTDLIIVYAEDTPKNMRYLVPKDLELAKVNRSELRALAGENLRRILPKIERHGSNGLYMLTAGGDYEASLLLLDFIWKGGQFVVQGDVVVAIPTRDLLLVTGSKDQQGIQKVRKMVSDASSDGSYRLTQKLFILRNGKFDEFTPTLDSGGPGIGIQPSR